MKLYLAGLYTSGLRKGGTLYNRLTEFERYHRDSASHLLESFHYINKERFVEYIRKDGNPVFLDSGAFSAFTKGVEIDLPGYCDYIKRNDDIIEKSDGTLLASVLDGIGDPLKTWQNQQAMEALGVRPLPCFHYGEDERYLKWYVERYDYITLGGMVPISKPQLYLWLDRIWEHYLIDGAGRPKLKVHGFGLTTVGLMERYPWYSVDSSSWIQIAHRGGVLVLPEAKVMMVSDRSPQRRVEGQHIDTLPAVQREAIERKLQSHGLDTATMRTTYLPRWVYNVYAYDQLGKMHFQNDPKFIPDQVGLFE